MQSTAPTLSSSYSVITELVRTQKLALSFVFGPPRGGTTAAERWLFESFAFDANVNQPGLLARDETGSRERVEATWSTVLRKYMEVFDPKAAGKTIRIIVKETSNVVLPNSELELWQKVCQCILLVYRNPVLQVESRIGCILNRISANATSSLGVPPTIDPRTFTITGSPLVDPSTNFDHIDESKDESLWEQHYSWMKQKRDYTSLSTGFVKYATLHPLFEEPAVQKEGLELFRKRHPGSGVSDADVEGCVGKKLEDIVGLPDFFHSAFCEWRFGWTEFAEQVSCLKKNLGKPGFCQNIGLVDMSDLQADPEFFKKALAPILYMSTKMEVDHVVSEMGSVAGFSVDDQSSCSDSPTINSRKTSKESKDESIPTFDVTSKGTEWDTWFLSSCDWDKMGKTADIRPPTKNVVASSKFPPFILSEIHYGMMKFVELKGMVFGLNVRIPLDGLLRFKGVDIVQDYVNEVVNYKKSGARDEDLVRVQANENNFGFLSLVKQACLSNGHVIPIVESEGEGKGEKRDLDTFLK
ncbi:hypothetical protein TL16_g03429 [Triparma laevis f. inornata]|uniref:Uncharacterized protein n=2 Tax=Triparma laevis TaxID=1534972 RepID=A0A9W7C624_9STRA|nr:hypothetical protein TL16_g03429 [Triparma laevis f. inornata]GMH99922.1 hypothetical protein TrLO_g778 [Triparma laevis f. longispina]